MSREIHDIPPAPRRVRWSTVFWHRWLVALPGLLLAIYGGVFTWMLILAWGGKPGDDARLDEAVQLGGARTVTGTVEAVEAARDPVDGTPVERVRYNFRPLSRQATGDEEVPGRELGGQSFAAPGTHTVGQEVAVEHHFMRPTLNRIRGTKVQLLTDWPRIGALMTVLPGCLVLLFWFAAMVRLRHLLATGDVAVAEIVDVRDVPLVVPSHIAVEYRYRDRRARTHDGRHWLRRHTPLGDRLLERPPRLPVVHSRHRPHLSRIVLPTDFLPPPSTTLPGERHPDGSLPRS